MARLQRRISTSWRSTPDQSSEQVFAVGCPTHLDSRGRVTNAKVARRARADFVPAIIEAITEAFSDLDGWVGRGKVRSKPGFEMSRHRG